jgi:GT2 family glycosyltransferase
MKRRKIQISIVIVSFNTKGLLTSCLESIRKHTKRIDYEIIVVDNASSDGSAEFIKKYKKGKQIKLIENQSNLGFAKANNKGIAISKGEYVILLNSDTEINTNLFKKMYEWMEKNKNIGVSTCKLVYPNGNVQSAGGYFPNLLRVASWMLFQDLPLVDNIIKPFQPHKELSPAKNDRIYENFSKLDWVAGTLFMIRRKVLKEVGYLDEDYFMYTEDVDYCHKVNSKGWGVGYNSEYEVVHHKGASGTSEFAVNQEFNGVKIYFRKHFPRWQYPILKVLLKLGSIVRVVLFYLIGKADRAKIYAKAFKKI